ncbi:MAG: minichromosome maintenance protein MCM [Candidatus Aenigmarchaeota archaeon]|nr:minichromosome maintenance protein MCM [Candidatus Aenigmarchaeota archaeon]
MELDKLAYDFLMTEKCYKLIQKAVMEGRLSVTVDFDDIDRYDPFLSGQLLESPDMVLKSFNKAISEIEKDANIKARIRGLPESRQIRIRNLRSEHVGKFSCIDCVIKSASEVKPQIRQGIFECPECASTITVDQDSNLLQKPSFCTSCGRRGDFPMKDKKMMDTRWLGAIEPFELTTGEQPGEIPVFMTDDLTIPRMQKKTDPGNRIKITGIMKEIPKWIKGKLSTKLDIYIEANHAEPSDTELDEIEISQQDEEQIIEFSKDKNIFKKLVASIAPGIYGHDEIKESLVLQMFGGVPHVLPDGSRIRDNIHVLITGDPGVGKSQLLKLIMSIVPRGKYVSGKGASGSGLTATVVKNEVLGGWVLEAGAMVLANKSIISIDEFDKMTKDDQIAMHEAMSIGTVSIAKASIVATLPAQTSVLAGANPKRGRFDPYIPVPEQLDIPETLLSRFDLKFALRDIPSRSQDELLAHHIIKSRSSPEDITPVISPALLRKYISYSRRIDKMVLTPEAAERLKNFYVDMRNRYANEEVPTIAITLRQYEALIRLAEASAKIRLDDKVMMEDAEKAIYLMKYSLSQLGMDPETGKIDIDRIESGVTASQRSKIRIAIEIIETLEKELGKEVPIEDVKAEAENRGLGNIDEILEKLKNEGMIYEPRSGFIRKL